MLSVKSSVMVSSRLNPESKLGQKQLMRNIPSIDLLRYFLFIILLFLSQRVLLLQCQDNPFIFLRLPNPNWITRINSCVLAPAASVRPGWCWAAWVLGQAWVVCLFSPEAQCAELTSTSFTRSHLKTPFASGLRRTNTRHSGFSLVVVRRPVLSASPCWFCCRVLGLFIKKKKNVLNHHVHWCTHTLPPPRLHPEIDLTTGVPSRNRKTRPCEVTGKLGQGPRSGAVVSFTGVQLFPHWKFYLPFVFLVHTHLWLYQSGGFLPI